MGISGTIQYSNRFIGDILHIEMINSICHVNVDSLRMPSPYSLINFSYCTSSISSAIFSLRSILCNSFATSPTSNRFSTPLFRSPLSSFASERIHSCFNFLVTASKSSAALTYNRQRHRNRESKTMAEA